VCILRKKIEDNLLTDENRNTVKYNVISVGLQNIDDSLDSLHRLITQDGVFSSYCLTISSDGEKIGDIDINDIRVKIAEVLGGSADDYEITTPLNNYGIDSLSTIEIVNWINRYVKITPS